MHDDLSQAGAEARPTSDTPMFSLKPDPPLAEHLNPETMNPTTFVTFFEMQHYLPSTRLSFKNRLATKAMIPAANKTIKAF